MLQISFLLALFAADSQPGIVQSEFVFETAPFASCHASTLAETPHGLIAAWFAGSYEKHPDVGIWVSRHSAQGWSTPVEVANGVQYVTFPASAGPEARSAEASTPATKRHPCWNPVLFQMPNGPLLLFFKCGPSPSTWWGMLTESSDGGATWSLPRRLPEGIAGPVKNKPVLLSDGRLLCPTSSEDDGWRVHFEWTSDLGRTWFRTAAINDGKEIGAIQPSILQHADGRLQAVGRTKNGKIFSTYSSDAGRSWSPLQLTALPNPNSGTDAVTLADGRQVLVYNHTPKGRTPLNVAVSANGIDWNAALVLESEPGEYSYPAVIQAKDGRVHIAYTWKRLRVKHVVVDPTALKLRPIVMGQWPE